ncbi:MAG: hypothetical protein QM636_09680 [Rhizobium sp.]
MPGETRFSGRMTILIVGFLFLIVATGMTMLAVHLYRSNGAPTALAASVVFAWAFASMLISMLLVLATSGKRVKGKVRARKGQVFVKLGDRSPASTAHVIGHGAEAEGEAGMRIVSRLPSVFLFASSRGLAAIGWISSDAACSSWSPSISRTGEGMPGRALSGRSPDKSGGLIDIGRLGK